MKTAALMAYILLCASAHAADPCWASYDCMADPNWHGLEQHDNSQQRQLDQIERARRDAEMERGFEAMRRENERYERALHDLDVQHQLDELKLKPPGPGGW